MEIIRNAANNVIRHSMVLAMLLTAGMFFMEDNVKAERPLAEGSPALVMQDCESPNGAYPTGVVIQKIGGGTVLKRKQGYVDAMLEIALTEGAKPVGLHIIAFCK